MKNVLIATFVGGLTYFLLGGLIYAVILSGFYEANLGSATGVMREYPVMWALIVSQLALAGLVAWVFLHAGVKTAGDGLKTGAIFGFLLGLAIALDLYSVTNWSNVTAALVEPFVTAVRISLGGAAIGWALGLGPKNHEHAH